MYKIDVKVLNREAISDCEKMMVAAARLTQRAEKINCMADFDKLYNKDYTDDTIENLAALPHPTLQKFGVINIVVVGASRRFLAQITRHQNEVKFMSGSLQYSDYSDDAQFCIPYEILKADSELSNVTLYGDGKELITINDARYRNAYLSSCRQAMKNYKAAACTIGNDAAGYMAPQGLRNVLIISATPYQWKHMISQRICRRNTSETRYVMLRCWEALRSLSPMFSDCGPSCIKQGKCDEGKMSCKHFLHDVAVDDYMQLHACSLATALLDTDFELIRGAKHDDIHN